MGTTPYSSYEVSIPAGKMPHRYRYHIEIDRDLNYVRLQNRANAYLEECAELDATVHSAALQWMNEEYHLTIVLAIPLDTDAPSEH